MPQLPGAVQPGTTTLLECPACSRGVGIPAGCVLRIPGWPDDNGNRKPYCHEVVDPVTGTIVRKGEYL